MPFRERELELMTAEAAEIAADTAFDLANLDASDIPFTPSGGLTATTVQDAIDEVNSLVGGTGGEGGFAPAFLLGGM